MPADRRNLTANKTLQKTERTHEENQERAYIAASRRSDRSLEARIESARRASEIHKKRTGRALRVTEQDVANEEMYEEEDDDLPTQYQRLNAHLHTSSLIFNRKLHDYLAAQHGVRNMYLSQMTQPFYVSPHMQPPNQTPRMAQAGNGMMAPPQVFSPSSPGFNQPQPFSPQAYQQRFRQSPYTIPQRPTTHQRSASIPTVPPMPNFDSTTTTTTTQQAAGSVPMPRDESRRMSLPLQQLQPAPVQSTDAASRPSLSRTTSGNVKQESSDAAPTPPSSARDTPLSPFEHTPALSFSFPQMVNDTPSQSLSTFPLSFSLPPESQQLLGSALDPNDPRTAIFMAGSDNLPQPFTGTYTYNPNFPAKSTRAGDDIKLEVPPNILAAPSSAMPETLYSPGAMFTPAFDYENVDVFESALGNDVDFSNNDQPSKDTFNDGNWINWDV